MKLNNNMNASFFSLNLYINYLKTIFKYDLSNLKIKNFF